jgi:hypothetical protein
LPSDSTAKLLLCTLCDDVRVEQNGKHILIGLFDSFSILDFTQPLSSFKLFARIGVGEEGKHPFAMTLRSDAGDFKIELGGEMQAVTRSEVTDLFEGVLILNIGGLRIPRPGRYHIHLKLGTREIGGVTFMVKSAAPPTLQ